MSNQSDINLPDWVWDLVIGLQKLEDEHPMYFRSGRGGGYEIADCGHEDLLKGIPDNVRFASQVLRRFYFVRESDDDQPGA